MGTIFGEKVMHYHFVGIGGIGMGALVCLLLDKGYKVSGSDVKENQVTLKLKERGATVYLGHQASQIEGADIVIYSSAIDQSNPELLAARGKNLPVLQRAKLLAELMKDYIAVTVAGAHGKTTTTSMISQLLTRAQLEPTTAIGGIVNKTSDHARVGEGRYFVAEVDESDGSFLYFSPSYSIITNIDFEHLDYYHNWDHILYAYRQFIKCTRDEGIVIANGEDDRLMFLLNQSDCQFVTFGFDQRFDVYAQDIYYKGFETVFNCYALSDKLGTVKLNVPGRHNVANALACIALGLSLEIPFDIIKASLEEFYGVQRRFQLKGEVGQVKVIDDYAHHPTEIQTTLQAAQRMKKNRLITIFQPHRFTRLKHLTDEFAQCLTNSDYLILTDVYGANEKPIEGVSANILKQEIEKYTKKPVFYLRRDDIINNLLNLVNPGDVVMTLGAGDITHIAEDFVKALHQAFPEKPVDAKTTAVT